VNIEGLELWSGAHINFHEAVVAAIVIRKETGEVLPLAVDLLWNGLARYPSAPCRVRRHLGDVRLACAAAEWSVLLRNEYRK
jgi:hypothetical protein